MGLIRGGTLVLLAGLVVVAHFALGKQAEWNGLFTFQDVLSYTDRTLPNTKIPIRLPETGIAPIDNYFAFMSAFFWGSLDVRNVRAHLQGSILLGTLGSVWILMLVEAHRGRRSFGFLITTYIFEFFGELVGIGLFTPIWALFHLLWISAPVSKSDLTAPGKSLSALGFAFLVGHVLPTVILIRSQPEGEQLASQQWWSVIRLFHPLFVFVSWTFFQTLQSLFLRDAPTTHIQPEQRLSSIRKFYIFAILFSGWFHASTLALLVAPYVVSGWLRPEIAAQMDLKTFFVPIPFWDASVVTYSPTNPVPFETGAAIFLQWDNLCAASAIVVWAAGLYLEAASKVRSNAGSRLKTLAQGVLVGLLAGPGAAAAYWLLERDSADHVAVVESDTDKKRQ